MASSLPTPQSHAPSATARLRAPPMRASHGLSPMRPPASRLVRIHLSNAQKLELCEYSAAHPSLAWDELAVWAAKKFRLRKPVSTTTVYRTLRSYESLQQLTPQELASRLLHARKGDSVYGQFETRLRDWIVHMAAQGMRLSGKTIKAEAHRLRAELDTDGSLAKNKFSNGWLVNFQMRHDISLLSLRKGGSVVVPDRAPQVHQAVDEYSEPVMLADCERKVMEQSRVGRGRGLLRTLCGGARSFLDPPGHGRVLDPRTAKRKVGPCS